MDDQNLVEPQPEQPAPPPWDYDTAMKLRDNGHITDETIARASQKYPGWAPASDAEAEAEIEPATPPVDLNGQAPSDAVAPTPMPPAPTNMREDPRSYGYAGDAPSQQAPSPNVVKTSAPSAARQTAVPAQQEEPPQAPAGNPFDFNPYATLKGGSTAGYDEMEAGIRAGAAAGAARGAEQAAQIDRNQKDDQRRIQISEQAEQERQRKMDEQFQKLQQAQSDLASQKVDPNHYWANKTTGDKVMAGIGMFLGAFGGTGTNMAVKTIDDAIARDIQTQKANIDIKRSSVDAQSGIYKDMFSRFKDERTAEDATRIAYYDNAKMKVEQISAKYAAPELKAKAQQLVGELEQKKIETHQSFMSNVLKNLPYMDGVNPEIYDKDKRERIVPGYQNLALTDKDATEMKGLTASARDAKTDLNRLLEISRMTGKSLDPSARSEASTIATRLIGRLKEPTFGAGARLNEAEIGLLEKLSGGAADITSLDSSVQKRLETLGDGIDKAVASKAKSFGLVNRNDRIQAEAARRGIKTVGTK